MTTKGSVPATFEALVRDYDHYIETILLRVSGGAVRRDDLPDLKQTVYLRLWQAWQPGSRSGYDGRRAAFSTYLFLIIRSVAINQFERNSREPDNQAYRIRLRSEDRPEAGTVSEEEAGQLRDEAFEARALTADLLARCRTVAEAAEDGAGLLRVLDACYRVVPTPHRLAKELDASVDDVVSAQSRLVEILRTLQRATA